MTSLWRRILGLGKSTVIESIRFDEETDSVIVDVRSHRSRQLRCGRCGIRASRFDRGEGRRRWRSLDAGVIRVWLEADAPRVNCVSCGPTVARVPWARHNAGHTHAFDDTVAWLVTRSSKSAVCELMRVAWRTVGSIITRVSADIDVSTDRFEGVRRIGIDEVSYKKRHKYLIVVVDHDTGRLLWAAPGRDAETVRRFFDALGPQRCSELTHVTSDEATWITSVVDERAPQAIRSADPFHVIKWAMAALDEVRRQAWNDASGRTRGQRSKGDAQRLRRGRYALWKNPQNLTSRQQARLEWIAKTNPRLHRAYLLKEGLRHVFELGGQEGKEALDIWLGWAQRSRIPEFVEVGRKVRRHRQSIDACLDNGLSNGLIESTNTKIRVLTRIAFGFKSPDALIALALLALGGHQPNLPRAAA